MREQAKVLSLSNSIIVMGGHNHISLTDCWELLLSPPLLKAPKCGIESFSMDRKTRIMNESPYSPQNLFWKALDLDFTETTPQPRTGHCMEIIGNVVLIFGGSDNQQILSDIWSFNLTTYIWKKINFRGYISPRSGSKSFVYRGEFYIYGGYIKRGGEYFNELFKFNLKSQFLTKIQL